MLKSMAIVAFIGALASASAATAAAAEAPYGEQYRPQFHFTPPQQWMNDPNGMVYYDGEYHLFYQYNPYANVWGPMHWGHALSRDLVHWQNLPIALFPDVNGTIFSGSAVFDAGNTSGFGTRKSPPLVAIFTYHDHLAESLGRADFQTQGLAYSVDKGRSWTKYVGNPVLKNQGSRDFRDPKVSWYAPQKKWIMTLAVHDHVAFYSSRDLKAWTHESDFGREVGGHGGVWECPDLIEMKTMGDGAARSVLLVSVNPGGPNGGSATQYFIGSFDGHRFVSDPQTPIDAGASWVDYGTDDYAGTTWSGAKPGDDRQIFLGWMSNWEYARQVPTKPWRSAMTIPRELQLVHTARGLELHSIPVVELAGLRAAMAQIPAQTVAGAVELTSALRSRHGLLELLAALDMRDATQVEFTLSNAQGQHTSFKINASEGRYEVDRSASGSVDFSPAFAMRQYAPIKSSGGRFEVRMLVDRSSLEIFINGGETVLTIIDFPSTPYDTISLRADRNIALDNGMVYELKSVWDNP